MATNEGEIGRAVRRDSPWWTDPDWSNRDRDLRTAKQSGLNYNPSALEGLAVDGLYLLYGPRRVGKTVAVKRAIESLLANGIEPLRIIRVSVDGWRANRLGMLYDYVTKVATSSIGDGRRYWFIDEITASTGEWWSIIKDLRDNTPFGDDCVVLTGSSNRNLDDAIKAFAGRRGSAVDPDRCLLPMNFKDFCAASKVNIPSSFELRPDELYSELGRTTWQQMEPFTDQLVSAWQAYLEVGGYPKAVSDWCGHNSVEPQTWGAIWDVVRGEAVTEGVSEGVVGSILTGIARRLTSTVAIRPMAEDLGIRHETLERRIDALVQAFLVWRCPASDAHGRPEPGRQSKLYFVDPLVAKLPELILNAPPVDVTHLNEQQLGVALLGWNERARRGSLRSGDWVTHYRTGKSEIDFAGRCPDNLSRATALEGKYVSGSWRREALTVKNSALTNGILATRDVLSVDPADEVWAVPASFIAFALGSQRAT